MKLETRPNLKELRDALNKIPDDVLSCCTIMCDIAATDDCSGVFGVIWHLEDGNPFGDEATVITRGLKKDNEGILDKLMAGLNRDLAQAKIREGESGWDESYGSPDAENGGEDW